MTGSHAQNDEPFVGNNPYHLDLSKHHQDFPFASGQLLNAKGDFYVWMRGKLKDNNNCLCWDPSVSKNPDGSGILRINYHILDGPSPIETRVPIAKVK